MKDQEGCSVDLHTVGLPTSVAVHVQLGTSDKPQWLHNSDMAAWMKRSTVELLRRGGHRTWSSVGEEDSPREVEQYAS